MNDPSQTIARELQPHIHLLSTYRFPSLLSLPPNKVADWLLRAPQIASDQAPFYWTYLDEPQDASILMVWQSPSVGNDFPSDGYIWAPPEQPFQVEVNGGYTLEMLHYKTGYSSTANEPLAVHSRRRFRLLPSKRPGSQPVDPSLWIVHYGHAEPTDRVPSNIIPVDMRMQSIMNTRTYLKSQGQIVRKEFMLHDRTNWPSIAFPRNQPRGAAMYAPHAPTTRVPQHVAYPPQHAIAGPPAKRARTQANSNQPAASSAVAGLDLEEEEDTARGDLFDYTTPREVAMNRYKQNHEWMEEILSSPYSINQIIPVDLGLGIRGGMAGLTDGIFDAPLHPDTDIVKHNYVGRLDSGKSDEFRKRVHDQIAQTNSEMEKIKAKHAKRLAKFQKGLEISAAEKELRTAVDNPSDVGPEYWRLEGRIDSDEDEDTVTVPRIPSKVSEVLANVEASLGRHAAAIQSLIRVQDGGYEEPQAVPTPQLPAIQSPRVSHPGSNNGSQNSGVLVDVDIEMGGGSAAGLLDQYHTGMSSHATPGSGFPTPQTHLQPHSATGTPGHISAASPQPLVQASTQHSIQPDINMTYGGVSNEPSDTTGTGDWVVIPPGGLSPSAQAQQHVTNQSANSAPGVGTPSATSAPLTGNPSPLPTASSNQTPLPDFHTSPNDFPDLGDLDSAGDALASYGADDMDIGDAFGDAFHGVETSHVEGDGDGL